MEETNVVVQSIDPVVMAELARAFYEYFYIDFALIGFSVVGSISAFATFWALRGAVIWKMILPLGLGFLCLRLCFNCCAAFSLCGVWFFS